MVNVEGQNPTYPIPSPVAPMEPGWKTAEFWLNMLALLVAYLSTTQPFEVDSWPSRIVGLLATVLIALGYSSQRAKLRQQHYVAQVSYNQAAIQYMKVKEDNDG